MNNVVNDLSAVFCTANKTGEIIRCLHNQCTASVEASLNSGYDAEIAQSYIFAGDLEAWQNVISNNSEARLISTASSECVMAMLCVCQGQYRNGFKGLRLVLELCLQCSYLSAHIVDREEWLKGKKDTIWALLMDETEGPLGIRFCEAFFPDLKNHIGHFRGLAKTVYRELSECIHGNTPVQVPLPSGLQFSLEAFLLWHEKAKIIRLIVHFTFCVRYLRDLSKDQKSTVESFLLDQLGHLSAIRLECSRGGV